MPAGVAAWGEPPIVLRCGVPRPSAFAKGVPCFAVNGVSWMATADGKVIDGSETSNGAIDFYTIWRRPAVEVEVPGDDAPQADPLAGLASAVKRSTRVIKTCD